MSTFRLPDLGEGLQEAEIVAWHVSVGDRVVADQPLLSVETEKAVVEIPSPQSGRIGALYGDPGDMIEIGETLVDFVDEEAADAGAIVGKVPDPSKNIATVGRPASPRRTAGGIKAAPAVRALATRLGVDLAVVAPTGPNGSVTKTDVERAGENLPAAGSLEPLHGVRRSMARNMTRSQAEVAAATVTEEADLVAWGAGADPTLRLIRAVAAGCQAEPSLNAWYDGRNEGRRLHAHIDLGIATDTPDGLFVPVLRDVGNRDDVDLRRGLDAMKADVVARSIPPEELRGQTITLSNFGMIAGLHGALMVVPPQVAILGAGRIAARVVVVDDAPAVHRVLPLSLTFDHRAVTGGEATRFLAAVVGDLERSA